MVGGMIQARHAVDSNSNSNNNINNNNNNNNNNDNDNDNDNDKAPTFVEQAHALFAKGENLMESLDHLVYVHVPKTGGSSFVKVVLAGPRKVGKTFASVVECRSFTRGKGCHFVGQQTFELVRASLVIDPCNDSRGGLWAASERCIHPRKLSMGKGLDLPPSELGKLLRAASEIVETVFVWDEDLPGVPKRIASRGPFRTKMVFHDLEGAKKLWSRSLAIRNARSEMDLEKGLALAFAEGERELVDSVGIPSSTSSKARDVDVLGGHFMSFGSHWMMWPEQYVLEEAHPEGLDPFRHVPPRKASDTFGYLITIREPVGWLISSYFFTHKHGFNDQDILEFAANADLWSLFHYVCPFGWDPAVRASLTAEFGDVALESGSPTPVLDSVIDYAVEFATQHAIVIDTDTLTRDSVWFTQLFGLSPGLFETRNKRAASNTTLPIDTIQALTKTPRIKALVRLYNQLHAVARSQATAFLSLV